MSFLTETFSWKEVQSLAIISGVKKSLPYSNSATNYIIEYSKDEVVKLFGEFPRDDSRCEDLVYSAMLMYATYMKETDKVCRGPYVPFC